MTDILLTIALLAFVLMVFRLMTGRRRM